MRIAAILVLIGFFSGTGCSGKNGDRDAGVSVGDTSTPTPEPPSSSLPNTPPDPAQGSGEAEDNPTLKWVQSNWNGAAWQ